MNHEHEPMRLSPNFDLIIAVTIDGATYVANPCKHCGVLVMEALPVVEAKLPPSGKPGPSGVVHRDFHDQAVQQLESKAYEAKRELEGTQMLLSTALETAKRRTEELNAANKIVATHADAVNHWKKEAFENSRRAEELQRKVDDLSAYLTKRDEETLKLRDANEVLLAKLENARQLANNTAMVLK